LGIHDLLGGEDDAGNGRRNRRCTCRIGLDRQSCVCRSPDHFNVIASGQRQHEIDRHQAVTINTAMPLLNAQTSIRIRHITSAAAIILAQPNIHIMNLRICVNKLNRERQAVDACVRKSNATAGSNRNAIIGQIIAVKRDRICSIS
jgi:hypothetical protein